MCPSGNGFQIFKPYHYTVVQRPNIVKKSLCKNLLSGQIVGLTVYSEQWAKNNLNLYINNVQCTVILAFYTAANANVHFTIKQVLQIIHTSLAIGNSFMRSLVRGTTRPECLC